MKKNTWVLKDISLQECINRLYCLIIKSEEYGYSDDEFNALIKAIDELETVKEIMTMRLKGEKDGK